jgi:hypothetical protein
MEAMYRTATTASTTTFELTKEVRGHRATRGTQEASAAAVKAPAKKAGAPPRVAR